MKRRAFTLMELLLVVAILAIISAAAAPTFTSGSADAIEEARKSNFLAAYENTVSGANLMMGLKITNWTATSDKGKQFKNMFLPENLSLDAWKQWIDDKNVIKNLNYFVPVGSRVFYSKTGRKYFVSAKIGSNSSIVFYWVEVGGNGIDGSYNKSTSLDNYHGWADTQARAEYSSQEIHLSSTRTLDDVWNEIKDR